MVRFRGHDLRFNPIGPQELLHTIAVDNWQLIIPHGLDEESQEVITSFLTDDPAFRLADCAILARKILENVAGVPYPTARRLAAVVGDWMRFHAWCIVHNFDPTTEPVSRTLAAAYAIMTHEAKPEDVAQTDAKLWAPDLVALSTRRRAMSRNSASS